MAKRCKKCGETKPLTEYHKDRQKTDGLSFYCKPCSLARNAAFLMRSPKNPTPEGMKRCCSCKETKALSDFHGSARTYDGKDRRCKTCCGSLHHSWRKRNMKRSAEYMRAYRANNLERMKEVDRKKRYGVEAGWYDATLKAQGGTCAICTADKAGGMGDFHIDHCHTSNKTRGLLCHSCNLMIGQAGDDTTVLESAIRYLNKHQK